METCVTSQPEIYRCCLQLQRSQPLPIHVVCVDHTHQVCAVPLLRILARYTRRWATFVFSSDHVQSSPGVFSRLLPQTVLFHCLKSLDYHCSENQDWGLALGRHFQITSLPILESLRIVYWLGSMANELGTESTPLLFPWAKLRHISLYYYQGELPSFPS